MRQMICRALGDNSAIHLYIYPWLAGLFQCNTTVSTQTLYSTHPFPRILNLITNILCFHFELLVTDDIMLLIIIVYIHHIAGPFILIYFILLDNNNKINNKSKMEKVQEIKNTTRLPRPETWAELDGGAASPVGDCTADAPNCVDGQQDRPMSRPQGG